MKKPYLSVVIPCYNEAANLQAGVLNQVEDYLKKQRYTWEVVIADDGSTDKSLKLVQAFTRSRSRFRLLKLKHGGKAAALRGGIEAAEGEIVLMTDMDQSAPLREVEKLLGWFDQSYEVVIGSRGLVRKGTSWYRKVMSVGFWLVRGVFVLREIKDTQCGFKAFRGEVIKDLFPQLEVFRHSKTAKGWTVSAFDVELLFLVKKRGYRLKEVVIDWENRDRSTTKKHNFVAESKGMALQVWQVWTNNLKGVYERQK